MTTTGVKAFVDTNVLLRANLVGMDQHAACDALVKQYWAQDAELWISGQVIREFMVQATHPRSLKQPLAMTNVLTALDAIIPLFTVADETAAVRAHLRDLLRAYPTSGKQIHDANIVATMLAYDVDTLLTLNTADFARFQDKITLVAPAAPS